MNSLRDFAMNPPQGIVEDSYQGMPSGLVQTRIHPAAPEGGIDELTATLCLKA
jgi:hypothetical protein